MTKEDALIDAQRKTDPYVGFTYIDPAIFKAMDEYAKQQSMEFAIWKEINTCRSGEGEWQARFDGWRKGHTIDQLYELFIEQQNK